MSRTPSSQPTERELEILRALWETGPAELSRICAALREDRDVANTTVATMLKVMLEKGLVRRVKSGRGSLWSARATRQATGSGMAQRLIDHLFGGSAAQLVTQLLEDATLSAEDRQEILRALRAEEEEDT